MPTFSAFAESFHAKGRVVSDGEMFTTTGSAGAQVVSTFPSTYTAFKGVPVRTGTGIWKITTRDSYFKVLFSEVRTYTTTGNAVSVIMQPNTVDSNGLTVINWTFCTYGTTTPADIAASQVFGVYFSASELSVS